MVTHLSWGERLITINAVPSSIPAHFRTCFLWPSKGIALIDKIRGLFLWDIKDEVLGTALLPRTV